MARTPLLRALQRLAAEHREAESLGIPPAELRGRREGALSRREFVKRAGLTGAAVAVGGSAALSRTASAARGASTPSVAIVGAGIAGLNAALTLWDKGYENFTIYEASTDRVGGRMHSDTGYWASNQVSEFCGELIDTGHMTIRHLAQRFSLPTADLVGAQPNGSTDTLWFLNGYYSVDDADKDFQPIHNTLQGQVQATSYPTTYKIHTDAGIFFDNMTVYDWIENYVPGGHRSRMGRMLDAAYNEEYGAETRDQAALNLMYLLAYQASPGNFSIFGKSDERFHIVGGNQQLPDAIADYIGRDKIKQGYVMQAIKANTDGTVTMSFSTGGGKTQDITADQVILCISFAVLRTLDYKGANFDKLKQTAITQLGAGRNSKLQLQFTSRYWNTNGPWGLSNGNVYSDIGIQNTWDVSRAQSGAEGILVNYSGGNVAGAYRPSTPYSNAATNAQVTTYAKQFLAKLEVVYPGITARWNGNATLSTPWLDPLLNCSYSYWKPGQYVGFSGYEGQAQGSIHFAGEHCSQDFQGYMEGGAAEGARAAGEILALVK
jgi:monoamine oxidase